MMPFDGARVVAIGVKVTISDRVVTGDSTGLASMRTLGDEVLVSLVGCWVFILFYT